MITMNYNDPVINFRWLFDTFDPCVPLIDVFEDLSEDIDDIITVTAAPITSSSGRSEIPFDFAITAN